MDEEVQTPQYISQVTLPNNETYDIKAKVAEADASGNNIQETYAADISISGHTLELKNQNGEAISSLVIPDNDTTYVATKSSINQVAFGSSINIPNIIDWGSFPVLEVSQVTTITNVTGGKSSVTQGVLTLEDVAVSTETSYKVISWTAGTPINIGASYTLPNLELNPVSVVTDINPEGGE